MQQHLLSRSLLLRCLLAALLLILVACSSGSQEPAATPAGSAATDTAVVSAETEATPAPPTRTPTKSPTDEPESTTVEEVADGDTEADAAPTTRSATAEPTDESPLATPEPAPTLVADPCTEDLSTNDALLAQQFPELGCPQAPADFVFMARQPFQQGQMIWRQDTQTIYVLSSEGRWTPFTDEFEEGDPESDPTLTAPEGLFQPIRGFGMIWRDDLGGADAAIGWASLPESGSNGSVQEWEHGTLISFGLNDRFILFENGSWQPVDE